MSSRWCRKRWLLAATTLALSLSLALVLAEGLMRKLGFSTWNDSRLNPDEPTMHEPDETLGWRNRPGSYVVPRFHPSGQDVHVTLEEPGRRRTAPRPIEPSEGSVVMIGDSFAVGWALNDEETFAWKLQERFPELEVLNFGTAGYGSYQSLLLLERVLPAVKRPRLVLYDFLEHHEIRNVAPDSWLKLLARMSRRGHVRVPFATVGRDGALVRHPPIGYPELPLRERSVFMNALGQAYMGLRTSGRLSAMRDVTRRILLEMNRVAESRDATLLVVLLGASPETKTNYSDFLASHGVAVVDCVRELTDDLIVLGDGHPNAKANSLWATCIAQAVAPRLQIALESNFD